MTNETTTKKKKGDDGELKDILIGCGVFTLALLIVDFTYGNIEGLMQSWLKIPFIILHIALFVGWILVINYKDDPAFEWCRKAVIAIAIAGLLLIIGHRVGFLDEKAFNEEVDKNKQEQQLQHAN